MSRIAQHGTYHTCVYVPGMTRGEEFDCGMDAGRSYNLIRVGDAIRAAAQGITLAQPLTGFIPPADAYDEASLIAMRALGYRHVAAAFHTPGLLGLAALRRGEPEGALPS